MVVTLMTELEMFPLVIAQALRGQRFSETESVSKNMKNKVGEKLL